MHCLLPLVATYPLPYLDCKQELLDFARAGGRSRLRATLRLGSGAEHALVLRLAPPPGTAAAAAEGGGAAVTAAAAVSKGGDQHLLFSTALDLDCPADAVAAGGAPRLELADKPQGNAAGSSASGAIGSAIQRWMASDRAGDTATQKIQLQFQLEELPCDTAAAAALAVVKERVIQWGFQLASSTSEPEAMAGMQREVAALRRGVAELQVGGWAAGSSG